MKNSGITQNNLSTILIECISALLILLFVYTATSKLLAHNSFVFTLSQSPLLQQYSIPLSWLIPFTEILISCLLFIPRLRKTGLLLSTILLTAFTIYISYMIAFTPKLPCSCGGVITSLTWREHLLLNISFVAFAVFGWLMIKKKKFYCNNRSSRTPV